MDSTPITKSEFKEGDTVQVGINGHKGKITDIIYPLGTFCLYKVRLFSDGKILTVARHELVKGLADDFFQFNQNIHSTCNSVAATSTYSTAEPLFESSVLDAISSEELEDILKSVALPVPLTTSSDPPVLSLPVPKENQSNVPVNIFAIPVEIDRYIEANENDKTRPKTICHQKLLETYLIQNNESRPIHDIPASELNEHLCHFMVGVRQKDGREYEPVTLRSMLGSFERYLKRHQYGKSLISGYEFSKLREVLKCKQKDLKKQGHGNKPMSADPISDGEIGLLYASGQLGSSCPSSLINSLWLNNTLHFGMRGGASEHRQLCWGDLNLCYDTELNCEYVEYNERQTKTRTGEDISNCRRVKPRMYATNVEDRCPVLTFKKYGDKRPTSMRRDDSSFYLAPVIKNKTPSESEQWFLSQPIGVNKLGTLLKSMAENSNLPDLALKRLTNTSVRKRLCQKLLENNVPDTQAIHITGHKNPQSLNNYRSLSNRQQHSMSSLLSSTNKENAVSAPIQEKENPINLTQSLSEETSFNIDTSLAFKSIFSDTNISGGIFNVTLNIAQPANKSRLE